MRFRRPALGLSAAALLLGACAPTPPVMVCYRFHDELCAQSLARGDLQTAETYCDLGLEFAPQNADLWANKGLIALQRQDTAQAKKHFLQALKYNPDHRQARVNLELLHLRERGTELMDQRRFGDAEAAFSQCLRMEATNAACLAGLEQARRAASP